MPGDHEHFDRLRRAADRLTDWKFHCWYWGDAIAIDALLAADDVCGENRYRPQVIETLLRWQEHCLPNFDDVLAPGAAIIRLIMEGDLPGAAGERLLSQLQSLPCAVGAAPILEPHRPAFRFGLCIDTLYHLPAFFALAGRWKNDPRLTERAIRIGLDGMRALQCEHGWAQWFDSARRCNNAVSWSRGLGWAILGLLDLLLLLEQPHTEIADVAASVLERLAATQEADGNWRAVLGHPASASETSTAAFYVAACQHPAARDLAALPASVLKRAEQVCVAALAHDGTFVGVSSDVLPSWDITSYERFSIEPSPWAQGCGVRAFAALVTSPYAA
jgi:unsaturated rhamnogalacturonyl hydrolase